MQNEGMLLASTLVFFRVHTRVALTLAVALSIAILSLATNARPPAPGLLAANEKPAAHAALPLAPTSSELPRSVLRLFVLLPQLVPNDR